jgi:hypothetical protein
MLYYILMLHTHIGSIVSYSLSVEMPSKRGATNGFDGVQNLRGDLMESQQGGPKFRGDLKFKGGL